MMKRRATAALWLSLWAVMVISGACVPSADADQALTTAKQLAVLFNSGGSTEFPSDAQPVGTQRGMQTELAATELADATSTPTPTPTPPYVIAYYEVQPGDTLWDIALRFGVSVSTLQVVNELEDGDRLSLGQVLLISERVTVAGELLPTATPTPIPCYDGCPYPEGDCAIKGVYARLDGTPMYLMPGDAIYGQLPAEVWFCREEDAQREGWLRWTEFGPAE